MAFWDNWGKRSETFVDGSLLMTQPEIEKLTAEDILAKRLAKAKLLAAQQKTEVPPVHIDEVKVVLEEVSVQPAADATPNQVVATTLRGDFGQFMKTNPSPKMIEAWIRTHVDE